MVYDSEQMILNSFANGHTLLTVSSNSVKIVAFIDRAWLHPGFEIYGIENNGSVRLLNVFSKTEAGSQRGNMFQLLKNILLLVSGLPVKYIGSFL